MEILLINKENVMKDFYCQIVKRFFRFFEKDKNLLIKYYLHITIKEYKLNAKNQLHKKYIILKNLIKYIEYR